MKFFTFNVKRKREGEEQERTLKVKVNVQSIMEAHEDYDPQGNRFLVIFLNNTREREEKVPNLMKNGKSPSFATKKVMEQISYIVDDQEAIDEFFSSKFD